MVTRAKQADSNQKKPMREEVFCPRCQENCIQQLHVQQIFTQPDLPRASPKPSGEGENRMGAIRTLMGLILQCERKP